jgi:hypothetical protein
MTRDVKIKYCGPVAGWGSASDCTCLVRARQKWDRMGPWDLGPLVQGLLRAVADLDGADFLYRHSAAE